MHDREEKQNGRKRSRQGHRSLRGQRERSVARLSVSRETKSRPKPTVFLSHRNFPSTRKGRAITDGVYVRVEYRLP